jgi:hypothetical protein
LSETQWPTALKKIYENSETELWISFAQSKASHFHETIKVTDGDKCTTESTLAVKTPTVKTKNMPRCTLYPTHGEEFTN